MEAPAPIDSPSGPSRLASLLRALQRASAPLVLLCAIVGVALIGAGMFHQPRLGLGLLLVVPVAVSTIAAGPFAGAAMAIGSAGLWTAVDLRTGTPAGPITAGSLVLRLVGLLFIVRALQALLELLDQSVLLSWTDELTGLPNRRALISRAEFELARMHRTGAPLTVAFLDVDAFKDINDRYGHERGDRILRGLGQLLVGRVRRTDLAARLGGDEFVLLLPETDQHEACSFLRSLDGAFRQRPEMGGIPFTVSVGAATFHAPPASVEVLLDLSDTLMYQAKHPEKPPHPGVTEQEGERLRLRP
jgi:diguanylate cyclase (GGDEF)-like protein